MLAAGAQLRKDALALVVLAKDASVRAAAHVVVILGLELSAHCTACAHGRLAKCTVHDAPRRDGCARRVLCGTRGRALLSLGSQQSSLSHLFFNIIPYIVSRVPV